jgi:hypothetical protein
MSIFNSPTLGDIELTAERQNHILKAHPELKSGLQKLSEVLSDPDKVRKSRFDEKVLLFYKFFATIKGGKYISVAVKTGGRNFILTAYITDRIRIGEKHETEKKYS